MKVRKGEKALRAAVCVLCCSDSEHDPFYIPHTNIPFGQIKPSNQENANRLTVGGEENAYEKEWSVI
jgi:hypothetical protein